MFETYRMLGEQREAELLQQAQRLHALPPARAWAGLAGAFSHARGLAARLRTSKADPVATPTEVQSTPASD
jgi:hypothetical protein